MKHRTIKTILRHGLNCNEEEHRLREAGYRCVGPGGKGAHEVELAEGEMLKKLDGAWRKGGESRYQSRLVMADIGASRPEEGQEGPQTPLRCTDIAVEIMVKLQKIPGIDPTKELRDELNRLHQAGLRACRLAYASLFRGFLCGHCWLLAMQGHVGNLNRVASSGKPRKKHPIKIKTTHDALLEDESKAEVHEHDVLPKAIENGLRELCTRAGHKGPVTPKLREERKAYLEIFDSLLQELRAAWK